MQTDFTLSSLPQAMAARRSHYVLGRDIQKSPEELVSLAEAVSALVPDAFDMRSQRLVLALGQKQEALWDMVFQAFGGQVAREKTDGFRAAYGTALFFTDMEVVLSLQEQYPLYAANFPVWAGHANGMLQYALWTALAAEGLGANLQHYNPVIDQGVRELFELPESWQLVAQMPFGSIGQPAREKGPEQGRVWLRQ